MATSYTILIDGYNVILRHTPWATLPLREARQRLIAQLHHTRWPLAPERIVVVFDTRESDHATRPTGERVQICFASPSADAYIQEAIRTSASPERLIIISDDGEILRTAKSHGSLRHPVSWLMQQGLPAMQQNRKSSSRSEELPDKPGQFSAQAKRITDELSKRWLGPSAP